MFFSHLFSLSTFLVYIHTLLRILITNQYCAIVFGTPPPHPTATRSAGRGSFGPSRSRPASTAHRPAPRPSPSARRPARSSAHVGLCAAAAARVYTISLLGPRHTHSHARRPSSRDWSACRRREAEEEDSRVFYFFLSFLLSACSLSFDP